MFILQLIDGKGIYQVKFNRTIISNKRINRGNNIPNASRRFQVKLLSMLIES